MSFYETVEQRFHDWNYDHPKILHGIIRAMKPDVVVEVGSYRGLTACWIAYALQLNCKGRLYCIDNWSLTEHVERYGDPRAHFEANIKACGVDGFVEILQGDSDKVKWPEKVDICYVDAFHSYECTRADVTRALNAGSKLVALDDIENCVGPRMFSEHLRDFCQEGWDFMEFHSDNGLFVMKRKEPKRPITFSQELPYPNPGVDLRYMTLDQQKSHFAEAGAMTRIDYSIILNQTEHDREVGT